MFLMSSLFFAYLKMKKSKPKKIPLPSVSIIIPAYNEEKNISKVLDSVLSLDYPKEKLQIIVVDDGSTDNTYYVAKRYESKGVLVLRKKNEGKKSYTLNYAIPFAKGEIIATLDADSIVERNSLKEAVLYFSDPRVASVVSAVKVWNKDENFITRAQYVEYNLILFIYRKLLELFDSIHVTPGPFSLFRREVLEERKRECGYYFDNNSLTEDHEIALYIQKKNYRVAYSPKSVVYTKVPSTLSELYKQRVRWGVGGLIDAVKYRRLLSFKYGDFMLFGIPLDVLYLGMLFLLLVGGLAMFFEPTTWNPFITMSYALDGFSVVLFFSWIVYALFSYLGYWEIERETNGNGGSMVKEYIFLQTIFPIFYMFVIAGIIRNSLRVGKLGWLTK